MRIPNSLIDALSAAIWRLPCLRRARRGGAGSRALYPCYQPVPIQDGIDGATGRHLHFRRQAPQQTFTNLTRTPTRLLVLGRYNGSFYLFRQLIGVPMRPPRSIREPFQPTFFVALKNLVSRLARDPEFPAQGGHRLPVFQPNHKPYAFVHHRTFLPWHPSFCLLKRSKVYTMSPVRSVTYVSGRTQT